MRPATLMLVMLAACAPIQTPEAPVVAPSPEPTLTPLPAPVAAWDDRPEGAAWTAQLQAALATTGTGLLAATPADATEFCPRFAALDPAGRERFYVGLISKMAQFESGFDPTTSFQESFNDAQGNPVISRGLLQLSIESANAYPGCTLTNAQQLHDSQTNLTCAVAILNRLVPRDGVFGLRTDDGWKGGAAYWSVLRTTSSRRAPIEAFTRALPGCEA
jgi:hypothetical protein